MLTAQQLAAMLHARRVGKNKWVAKCPAHQERTGSLYITPGKDGSAWAHCFGGCDQKAVLDALGLTWSDLKPEGRIDPEIVRQIRVQEELRKAQKEERTRLLWWARKRIEYWHRKAETLGRSLWKWPEQAKLARDFHHALDMERRWRKIWEVL